MSVSSAGAPRRRALVLSGCLFAVFVALFIVVVAQWGPIRHFDHAVDDRLNRAVARHPGWVRLWQDVSLVGQPIVFETLSVVAAVALWWRGRRRAAVFVVVGVIGAVLAGDLVKEIVRRERPVVHAPIASAHGYSFTSGHAMASWAAAIVVLVVARRGLARVAVRLVSAAALVVALAVASSRLWLGVHYPSDVVGAWLLGTAWVLASAAVCDVWRDADQVPTAASGAASTGSAST